MLAVLVGPGEVATIVIMAVLLTILASRDRKMVRREAVQRYASKTAGRPTKLYWLIAILAMAVVGLSYLLVRLMGTSPAA